MFRHFSAGDLKSLPSFIRVILVLTSSYLIVAKPITPISSSLAGRIAIPYFLSRHLVFQEPESTSHSSGMQLWVTWLMLGPCHIPQAQSYGYWAFRRHSEAAGHLLCQG